MDKEGLSIYELAKKTGIKERTIKLYLEGFTSPSSKMIRVLCRYFNVTADYLIGLKDESVISARAERVAKKIDAMRRFEQNWSEIIVSAIKDKMDKIRNPNSEELDSEFMAEVRNSR